MIRQAIYKIVLAGDGGVGKTTLLRSKLAGKFEPVSKLTVGVDFECYPIETPDETLTILVFDLGGQDHFHFIHKAFILGERAAIIVYDLTRIGTIYNIPHWIELVTSEYPAIPIMLAGSKLDMVNQATLDNAINELRGVILSLPKTTNIVGHLPFSANDPASVSEVFAKIQNLAEKWKDQMLATRTSGVGTHHM